MKPVLCRHCLQEEKIHTAGWHCQSFEPRRSPRARKAKRARISTPAAPPPTVDYIARAVRTQLAQTFRYLAGLLEIDASVIAQAVGARPTSPAAAAATDDAVRARSLAAVRSRSADVGAHNGLHPRTSPPAPPPPPAPRIDARAIPLVAASLGEGHREILAALAQSPDGSLPRDDLSIVTGHARSTRNRLLQELARFGLVDSTHTGNAWRALDVPSWPSRGIR